MNPIFPGNAKGFANVAFNPMCGNITPTQFGPMIRIFPRRSRICLSSSAPVDPHSLKPAEMITAPLTPAAAHSPIIFGTIAAGVAITARSTFFGTSRMLRNVFCPNNVVRLGLTKKTRPLNDRTFSDKARPTLPAFSLAPITATPSGANIEAKFGRAGTIVQHASGFARSLFSDISS
jgi:hypothetical protein